MIRKSRVQFESEIESVLDSTESIGEKIHRFIGLLSGYLDDAAVSLFLYEAEAGQLFLKSTSMKLGADGNPFRFSADGTIASLALNEKRTVSMEEIKRPDGSALEGGYFVIPLLDGKTALGVVTVQHVAPAPLKVIQRDVVRRALQELSKIVGEAKKETELSHRMTKISAINEAGITLVSHKDLSELLTTSTAIATLIMDAGSCVIRTYDEVTGSYLPGDSYGLTDEDLRQLVLHLDSLVVKKMIGGGKPVLFRDLSRMEEFGEYAGMVRTLICHPLKADGDIIGTMTLFNKNAGNTFSPPYFTDDDLGNLSRLAKYVEQGVAEAIRHGRTKELQERDEMTGLPGRRYFTSRLGAEISRAQRFESPLVILSCRTGLVQTGESLHYKGRYRTMIRKVAKAIRDALREYDIVAALGEGEFAMILPQVEEGTESAVVRVELALGRALKECSGDLDGASMKVGFAKARYPDDGDSAEALLAALKHT